MAESASFARRILAGKVVRMSCILSSRDSPVFVGLGEYSSTGEADFWAFPWVGVSFGSVFVLDVGVSGEKAP